LIKEFNELELYLIITIAGMLYDNVDSCTQCILYRLQIMAISQLSNFGVDDPFKEGEVMIISRIPSSGRKKVNCILNMYPFSDNYRAWFALWTNHFNNFSKKEQKSFLIDFNNKKDLSKYYPNKNWENTIMNKWIKMSFPIFLEKIYITKIIDVYFLNNMLC